MTRVLLADDHPLFRQALRAVITREHPQLEFSHADSLAAAKVMLARHNDVVLVMLDLKMSDCSDFAGLLNLRGQFPHVPVVVVSSSSDASTISRAMAFGAAGFIPKSSNRADIARAVSTVLAGERWAPPASNVMPMPEIVKSVALLTPAQLQILMGLKRGLRNKEIAHEMGVTEKTVKAYTTTMYRKLGVTSRTQALIAVQTLTAGTEIISS